MMDAKHKDTGGTPMLPSSYMPQLDGLRALAMIGVCYHHWLPKAWRFHFPTEAGLFLFFTLSGFLMTRGLLLEKNQPLLAVLKKFHRKRIVRIIPAYYFALIVAAVMGVKEVWQAPQWWFTNLQNFRIIQLGYWPPCITHFWTLAVEYQYYVFFPFVILLTPRKFLPYMLSLLFFVSPLSRTLIQDAFSPDLYPWCLMDDFAAGGVLACIFSRKASVSRIFDAIGIVALGLYLWLYISWEGGHKVAAWACWQQSFLAIVMTWIIARAALGQTGIFKKLLENPWMQKLGLWSFGIYLFHNIAPLFVGKTCWFLWSDKLNPTAAILLRVPFYILFTALLVWISQKFVEKRFTRH